MGDATAARVRTWHEQAGRTTAPTALAQSYRLLRSLLNVAVADELISVNPCRLKGAGAPVPARASRALTVHEVRALADAVPARHRALVLVLAYGGLRFGEATALHRRDVSEDGMVVHVDRSVRKISGQWHVGPPKSAAGRRDVDLPDFVAHAVVEHLDTYVPIERDALVFAPRTGNFLAPTNFGQTFRRAVSACGLPSVRVHDLRHTGATLYAQLGATEAELMARFGHASPDASRRYQHAARHRGSDLARALDALACG